MRIGPSQLLQTLGLARPAPQAPASAASSMAADSLSLSGKPRLAGGFVQLNGGHLTEPEGLWAARLQAMKAAGMDTVVIQYTAHNGDDLMPAAERVLTAADALGMKVWVGAPLEERAWWTQSWSPFFLSSVTEQVARETRETVEKVAAHPSFSGLYVPYETNGLASPWAMGDFFGAISKAAKEAKPGTQVMISPYTNLVPGRVGSLPPRVLTAWWDTVLSRANIDVLAWQDGVGGVERQLTKVDDDLGALAKAAKAHGVTVWGNVEAFERTTPLTAPFAAKAADFERLEKQLKAVQPYVDRIITFDFNDYMDPTGSPDQQALYQAYKDYATGT